MFLNINYLKLVREEEVNGNRKKNENKSGLKLRYL